MVYCGRPSRGCQTCKSRHIKCDEVRPSCSNCTRLGWQCPGYTDVLDLMFRDETTAIKRRMEKRSRRGSRAARGVTTGRRDLRSLKRQSGTVPPSFLPSPEPQFPEKQKSSESDASSFLHFSPGAESSLASDNGSSAVPSIANSASASPFPYLDPYHSFGDSSYDGDAAVDKRIGSPLSNDDDHQFYRYPSPPETTPPPPEINYSQQVTETDDVVTVVASDTANYRTELSLFHAAESAIFFIQPHTNFQDVATTFFFERFVLPNLSNSHRSFLDHLVPAYLSSRRNSPLQHAAHAVAMCSLANYPGCRMLSPEAKKSYGKALRAVNQSMSDPKAVRTDETLMAVILFALYEEISSEHTTTTAWENHIDGAVALIKLRGNDIVKHPRSKTLFEFVRQFLISFSLQYDRSADDFPNYESWESLGSEDTPPLPSASLGIISLALPGLKVEAKRLINEPRTPNNLARLMECIKSAMVIDSNLEAWMRLLPEDWHPKTAFIQPPMSRDIDPLSSQLWTGHMHVYGNTRQSYFWNNYRVNRLVTHTIIANCARALVGSDMETEIKYTLAYSEYMIEKMADDICSSVVYNLDATFQKRYPINSDAEVGARASGAYFILWPLAAILRFGAVLEERKRMWIVGRLLLVSELYGLRRARRLLLGAARASSASPPPASHPSNPSTTMTQRAVC